MLEVRIGETIRYIEFKWLNYQGACGSGKHTITEDGPDLESWRLSYSLLRELYSGDELVSMCFEL